MGFNKMIINRTARSTLTPIEMFHGDTIKFTLSDSIARIELLNTGAEVMETSLKKIGQEEPYGKTTYRFWGDFIINGKETRLLREVGTQKSFYEPWVFNGLRLWFDAVDAIFEFMQETHGPCRLNPSFAHRLPPRKQARLVLQDVNSRICPEKLHPWCPLPEEGIKIENCYQGEDCWMGAFDGASAHGGLDLNHPKGTPLHTPFDLDNQFLARSVIDGAVNNSWRGFRRWDSGSDWVILSAHMSKLLIPEYTPLKKGTHYAEAAGIWVGTHEHSHFTFVVNDLGDTYHLDPWILFWQMYLDQI